mgnify:CR=1 FL=1
MVDMNGQWIGKITGSNNGTLCLNIEDFNEGKGSGTLLLIDNDIKLPSFIAQLDVVKTGECLEITGSKLECLVIDSFEKAEDSYAYLKRNYQPGVQLPNTFKGIANSDGLGLRGTWDSTIGTAGSFGLFKYDGKIRYDNTPVSCQTWEEFKANLTDLKHKELLYRGQSDSDWGLRTSFHRTGRADLAKYFKTDIPKLYRHINAVTGLTFDLNNEEDLGSLMYLAQHHGYPTPLLDWTYSPYVAAFFAFSGVKNPEKDQNVRIYIFDHTSWADDTLQVKSFKSHGFTLTFSELLASGNERALPQQAVTTFSNVDWIEAWIGSNADNEPGKYLKYYDIPASERNNVMADLRHMGITASSLFPGLDGICQDLKERYF